VADLGEEPGRPAPSPLFWVKKKKSQKEEKPVGQAKQNRYAYFVLHARALCACVRVQFLVCRGSIIPPTEEGLSLKCLDYQRIFDTFKSLLSLISNLMPLKHMVLLRICPFQLVEVLGSPDYEFP